MLERSGGFVPDRGREARAWVGRAGNMGRHHRHVRGTPAGRDVASDGSQARPVLGFAIGRK